MKNSYDKKFSLSINLWVRSDVKRQKSMDYWRGPHSKIIANSKGLLEYRQLHLSESEHSFWPKSKNIETIVSEDRRIDGIAEVTYKTLFSPIFGIKQTKLAFADEINVFRRTLMQMGFPFSSRWMNFNKSLDSKFRDVIYFRRRDGINSGDFKKFINGELWQKLEKLDGLTELRSQVYMPWFKASWNTPNVAHDNPKEEQLHSSVIIGFESDKDRDNFYKNLAVSLNDELEKYSSAVYAYKIEKTLVFVEDGKIL